MALPYIITSHQEPKNMINEAHHVCISSDNLNVLTSNNDGGLNNSPGTLGNFSTIYPTHLSPFKKKSISQKTS